MKDASILGNLRGMLVDEIHGLRYMTTFVIVTHEENLIENCGQIIRLKDGEAVIE